MAKIVIAEDEPDIRELIAFTLRFAGHEVIAGSNGQEGYDLTKKEHPDLAMFDVRMPRMTGYDACKMIKADPEIAHIPVIFLSAKGQENEIEQGLASGADDYLLKPFAPDQLAERVKAVLAKYGK
jgi:DNA-binding response OmpR family regulator